MDSAVTLAQVFGLVLARTAAFIMQVPVLGTRTVPNLIKAAVALMLSFFMFHWNAGAASLPALAWPPFIFLLLKEALVGWLMGFTLVLMLAAFQAAGELVGFQMMFSAASTFSLLNLEQTTVTGNLFNILAMLVFVALDGHHSLLNALNTSFQVLPVLKMPHSLGPLQAWTTLLGRIFEVGVKLALPLMLALFCTNIILGMIARTMPQINVFVIGMPVQIITGFLVLILMLAGILSLESAQLGQWAHELKGFIYQLKP